MGEVTISVAGRAYQVICEDGEEDRLNAIASRVDQEAQAFGDATPSLSESRLLLMCSLLLADKLDEAERSAAPSPAPAAVDTSAIEDAAARIEALATGDTTAIAVAEVTTSTDASTENSGPEAETAEAAQSERRSKSSAAVAAEKDLLSWLDRPETRSDAPPSEPAPNAPQHTPVDGEEPALPEDPEPATAEEEESDEDRVARERSERRARRRERLARLAKQNEDG